jgi:hypothetical protein
VSANNATEPLMITTAICNVAVIANKIRLHRPEAEGAGLQRVVDRVGRVMTVRHEQAVEEPPHPRRVLMTVIMVMSLRAAVLVVMTLIVVVAMLDVDRVAVLTVNMLFAVGCERCRIGVYGIMPAGRTVALDIPGRARCVILPVPTDLRVGTVHRSPSCRVRLW